MPGMSGRTTSAGTVYSPLTHGWVAPDRSRRLVGRAASALYRGDRDCQRSGGVRQRRWHLVARWLLDGCSVVRRKIRHDRREHGVDQENVWAAGDSNPAPMN